MEDELGQAAEVADSGREFLDVVVAEVEFAESCKHNTKYIDRMQIEGEQTHSDNPVYCTFKGQHPHVHAGQFAVGHLELLQRAGEVRGEGVVLPGHDGEFLLGLFHVSGTHRSERGEREAARVTSSVCQPSG